MAERRSPIAERKALQNQDDADLKIHERRIIPDKSKPQTIGVDRTVGIDCGRPAIANEMAAHRACRNSSASNAAVSRSPTLSSFCGHVRRKWRARMGETPWPPSRSSRRPAGNHRAI
jgi:hypothetical protein